MVHKLEFKTLKSIPDWYGNCFFTPRWQNLL